MTRATKRGTPSKSFVFSVGNHHPPECGIPPRIHANPSDRHSYFENEHGEQFIAAYSAREKRFYVWSGDLGWEKHELCIYKGELCIVTKPNNSCILNDNELQWLRAFVEACNHSPRRWRPRLQEAAAVEYFRSIRFLQQNSWWSRAPAIRVFISSPADLKRERRAAVRVCMDIGKSLGLPVRPILWEGGGPAHPEIPGVPALFTEGSAQGAIDHYLWNAIGGCDIYLGMIWGRMGTPTAGLRSGTEAEFRKAMEYRASTKRPSKILFYRKVSPIPPSKIDTEQFTNVQSFASELRELGILREVESSKAFVGFIKHDLTECITDILKFEPLWRAFMEREKRESKNDGKPA